MIDINVIETKVSDTNVFDKTLFDWQTKIQRNIFTCENSTLIKKKNHIWKLQEVRVIKYVLKLYIMCRLKDNIQLIFDMNKNLKMISFLIKTLIKLLTNKSNLFIWFEIQRQSFY